MSHVIFTINVLIYLYLVVSVAIHSPAGLFKFQDIPLPAGTASFIYSAFKSYLKRRIALQFLVSLMLNTSLLLFRYRYDWALWD